jgi:hypothetical protein
MTFGRQWFHPSYSVGLSEAALKFESLLRLKDFKSCRQIAYHQINIDTHYWMRQLQRLQRVSDYHDKFKISGLRKLKVSFSGFWPDFDPEDNQILDFLRLSAKVIDIVVTHDMSAADIVFFTCYQNNELLFSQSSSADRWLFLGENVRPQYRDYDHSLSMNLDSFHGRNTYLPLYMLEIDFFGRHYQDRSPRMLSAYTKEEDFDYSVRNDSVVYIGNNSEPLRESIITELIHNGITVDRYGSHTNPVQCKQEVYRRYKVVLAPENSYHPGYVTEKLLHAHLSGAHVIYWGCLPPDGFLMNKQNQRHILRICSGDELQTLVEFVQHSTKLKGMFRRPPLLSTRSIVSLYTNIISRIQTSLLMYL